jgi:hypothetical protein
MSNIGFRTFVEWTAEQDRIGVLGHERPGVYAAAHAVFEDQARVDSLIHNIVGEKPEKLHCTIVYSKRHVAPEALQPVLSMWDQSAATCRAVEVRAFANPSKSVEGQPLVSALVLILEAEFMRMMNGACMDLGCTADHAEYFPHVTLLYGVHTDQAQEACRMIQDSLATDPLMVTLSNPYIEPLTP